MRKGSLLFGSLSLLLLLAAPGGAADSPGCKDSEPYFKLADGAMAPQADGYQAFAFYRQVSSTAARVANPELGARIAGLRDGVPVAAADRQLASCMLRSYLLARYGDRMVKDLQEMVRFPTFATAGKENWEAPDFVRQREWLEERARGLGLDFKSYDGRVDEITLQGPKPVLALLTHGDVQGVENQTWSSPPFEGKLVDGRIIGRGAEDDKGPLVAALYALAALHDSGWNLRSTVHLLVANGEESSWDEIPYYLARAPMPERTIGLDAAYPVVNAQKGYGILRFRAQPVAQPKAGKWRVVRMSGGSGMSIIPEKGEAVLERLSSEREKGVAQADLTRAATIWAKAHPPAKLTVTRDGGSLKVQALGHAGHSSEPSTGHNALGDLTAFLATLDLQMDAWGALASFTGIAVGTETDGRSLGIDHRDSLMGALTSNLSFLREDKGTPIAEVNIRVPRGIGKEEIEKKLAERTVVFTRRAGAAMTAEVEIASQPHIEPAEGELVSGLLAAWQDVTGTPGKALAIGGGTQARLFKGGVDFGPATDMLKYRGHGVDEYLTPDELHRIAVLTAVAVWKLEAAAP
ncbi:MAG TPA: Sapep family Mn(2+)-dependent dipeptidase [Thermoanaerobaculia bacterium]|nr:Sapep family Mn(2+)-dependent dipeptidase [Thermoanaerobaculia bacterium]